MLSLTISNVEVESSQREASSDVRCLPFNIIGPRHELGDECSVVGELIYTVLS